MIILKLNWKYQSHSRPPLFSRAIKIFNIVEIYQRVHQILLWTKFPPARKIQPSRKWIWQFRTQTHCRSKIKEKILRDTERLRTWYGLGYRERERWRGGSRNYLQDIYTEMTLPSWFIEAKNSRKDWKRLGPTQRRGKKSENSRKKKENSKQEGHVWNVQRDVTCEWDNRTRLSRYFLRDATKEGKIANGLMDHP